MKTSCMHCVDPSCVSACPVSAMTKDPVTGIVGYDPDACIGCRYCVAACPFGIPKYQYDSPTGKIGKCELCRHRHKDGHYSACAEVCPTGATLYGKHRRPEGRSQTPAGAQAGPDDALSCAATFRKRPGSQLATGRPTRRGGNYLQHLWRKGIGGTQVLKLSAVNFEKLGHARRCPPDAFAAQSETHPAHALRRARDAARVLGAMTFVAKRNVKPSR
jgi:Fe-S-cluster-containing dehydrogenase component